MEKINISSTVNLYEGLQNCFNEFKEKLKNIPTDNLYKLSIVEKCEKNKFYIKCFDRYILVYFSSFFYHKNDLLGTITIEINDDVENKIISLIYFDRYGNNYFTLENTNAFNLVSKDSNLPIIDHVLEKFIIYMNNKTKKYRTDNTITVR